jgi:dTDP-4-dehydrorhamnose reductase
MEKRLMRVLITGGTGLLGKALFQTKPIKYSALGVRLRKTRLKPNAVENVQLDIRNKMCVERLFNKHKFDVVIHTAGIASVDYVKNNYSESLESNIVGTLNISSACRKNGSYLIYISSNAVFDGTSPPYDETSIPKPINEYGEIKLECERLIEKTIPSSCIIRPILMYGWNYPEGRSNPVTWVLEQIIKGQRIKVVNDVWENPLYNIDAAKAIWRAVQLKPAGKIHLAGPEVVNRYQLARQTVEIFGLDHSLISPVSSDYFLQLASRPKNTSFSLTKMLKKLGITPLSIKEGLQAMKKELLKKIKNPKGLGEIAPCLVKHFKA